jgi:DNA-binding IclR family transcriptional regulator
LQWPSFGRNSQTALSLLKHLYRLPIVSVRNVEAATGLSRTNASKLVAKFLNAGILVPSDETTEYGRTFAHRSYLDQFSM